MLASLAGPKSGHSSWCNWIYTGTRKINRWILGLSIFERSKEKLAVQESVFIEKERYEVSADDLERYFETVGMHLRDVPSLFMWNVDETRIRSPKKERPPQVTAAKNTPPGKTSVAVVRDDAQLILLTAISAPGDSNPPRIISKNHAHENIS
jgi:hypothetical protein